MKKLFLLAFAAFALAACSDDNNENDSRIPATAVVLDCEEQELVIGETLQIKSTVTPSDATDNVVWSSDNAAVATVSESGLVTALTAGTTVIEAKCGKVSATCTVSVIDVLAIFDVVSFEASDCLMDVMTGEDVVPGDVTMSLFGAGEYTYKNVFCAKAYATDDNYDGPLFMTSDQNLIFNSYYANAYDAWGGIALAQSPDMTAAASSSEQQFSVWAAGGAYDTQAYAVCYDSNTPTEAYPEYLTASGYPTIDFIEARTVDHLYIANSTLVYNYFTGSDDDNFQVKITGWNGETEKGSVTETLVSGATKLSGWRKVSLASFGDIDKLVFKVSGINVAADPSYFCIDQIALVKQAAAN